MKHYMALGLLHFPADAGAGSGGQNFGQGQGAGGETRGSGTPYDTGQGQGQRQAGGTADGQGTPYKLTDDSLILGSDGKAVKYGDYRAKSYVPRSEHDTLRTSFEGSRQLLTDHARRLDQGFAELERQRKALGQGQRQQQQEPDLADELAAMPLLDGATAARVVKQLQQKGLAPIAQLVAQQQATIKQLTDGFQQLRTQHGAVQERHSAQEFDSHVTSALSKVGEVKGLSFPVPSDNKALRGIAEDLWLSYDAKTWTLDQYHAMLNERIAGLVALVKADQARAVEEAKTKKRTFFNPNAGQGQGSGQGGAYKHLRGIDIARQSGIFDRSNAA